MNPFSPRAIRWIVGVTVVSLLTGILLLLFGPELKVQQSAGTTSFSISAIGNRGFVELLREVDIPVLVSRRNSDERAAGSGLLILSVPDVREIEGGDSLVSGLAERYQGTTLLVLPKYWWTEDSREPDYVQSVEPLDIDRVESVLAEAGVSGRIVRPLERSVWRSDVFDHSPSLRSPQVIASSQLTPLMANADGILIGETILRGGHRLVILSDPDLVANFRIFRGDNAVLATHLVEHLWDHSGTVVFDETIHGYHYEPSLWSELVRFPLVFATFQGVALIALLLWATMRRFGAPRPAAPPHAPGKDYLIQTTAELLWYGRHSHQSLRRYLEQTVRQVAKSLKAPLGLSDKALAAWLDNVAAQRGVVHSVVRFERELAVSGAGADPRHGKVLQIARRIHRWKQEMLDES